MKSRLAVTLAFIAAFLAVSAFGSPHGLGDRPQTRPVSAANTGDGKCAEFRKPCSETACRIRVNTVH